MDGCFVTLMRTSLDSLEVQWKRKPGEMGVGWHSRENQRRQAFKSLWISGIQDNRGRKCQWGTVSLCEKTVPLIFPRNLPVKKLSNQTPALKHWLCHLRAHRVPTIPRLWHWIYLSSPSSQWNLSCSAFSVTTSLQDWSFLKWQLS